MSYFNILKANDNMLALVESIDEQRKLDAKGAVSESQGNDPFSLDDINDTVDIGDQENGLEAPEAPTSDDIELSDDDKAVVRKNLQSMLDELSGDDISKPALEMILEEVATNCAYLNESEDASTDSPVEKNNLLKAKKDAIIKYAQELLELGIDNDGTIPEDENKEGTEDVDNTSTEGEDEGSQEPTSELPTEEDEKIEPLAEDVDNTSTEGGDEGSQEPPTGDSNGSEDDSLDEGVCQECDKADAVIGGPEDEVVEVNPDDVIEVVSDSDVEPIDGEEGIPGEEAEEGSKIDELSSKVDKLTELISQLAGNQQAVFEAAGIFGDYTNKNVEGGDPVINNGAQHPDFQKKITPATKSGELKIAELRKLASTPKKITPATAEGRENEAEVAKANSGVFKADSRDQGKGKVTPVEDGGYSKAIAPASAPKKLASQKEVTPQVKAAVLRESKESGMKTFLDEARKIIRAGR